MSTFKDLLRECQITEAECSREDSEDLFDSQDFDEPLPLGTEEEYLTPTIVFTEDEDESFSNSEPSLDEAIRKGKKMLERQNATVGVPDESGEEKGVEHS